MANPLNLVPFLGAGILVFNPLILIIFRRWEVNILKLRFWYMVTSTAAWIFLTLTAFIGSDMEIGVGIYGESDLLPGPVFRLEHVYDTRSQGGKGKASADDDDIFTLHDIPWVPVAQGAPNPHHFALLHIVEVLGDETHLVDGKADKPFLRGRGSHPDG